jgi:predicted nucleic acid-binding protein
MTVVERPPQDIPQSMNDLRDSKDAPILRVARFYHADYLATGDKNL